MIFLRSKVVECIFLSMGEEWFFVVIRFIRRFMQSIHEISYTKLWIAMSLSPCNHEFSIFAAPFKFFFRQGPFLCSPFYTLWFASSERWLFHLFQTIPIKTEASTRSVRTGWLRWVSARALAAAPAPSPCRRRQRRAWPRRERERSDAVKPATSGSTSAMEI